LSQQALDVLIKASDVAFLDRESVQQFLGCLQSSKVGVDQFDQVIHTGCVEVPGAYDGVNTASPAQLVDALTKEELDKLRDHFGKTIERGKNDYPDLFK
jgi:hypothetical protein